MERFFCSLESLKGKQAFGSCWAAQTAVTSGYKSYYHEAGLQFYRINATYGALLQYNISVIAKCMHIYLWPSLISNPLIPSLSIMLHNVICPSPNSIISTKCYCNTYCTCACCGGGLWASFCIFCSEEEVNRATFRDLSNEELKDMGFKLGPHMNIMNIIKQE